MLASHAPFFRVSSRSTLTQAAVEQISMQIFSAFRLAVFVL
jgi:hypothetical protein